MHIHFYKYDISQFAVPIDVICKKRREREKTSVNFPFFFLFSYVFDTKLKRTSCNYTHIYLFLFSICRVLLNIKQTHSPVLTDRFEIQYTYCY